MYSSGYNEKKFGKHKNLYHILEIAISNDEKP